MTHPSARPLIATLLACSLISSAALAQMHHDPHGGPVMNYHAVNDDLLTGGHFVDDGMEELAEQGVTVVIDLRDEPPRGQKKKLAKHGIEWINVPVVWRDPQPEDYEAFAKAMAEHEGETVLVQCQGNYRASAFAYLYRVKEQGVAEEDAAKDLNAIWEPEGTWERYMDGVLAQD